jgi:hypothetical protein
MKVPEEERMSRLTDQFIDDLNTATEGSLIVVLFDAVERMTKDTESWVWNELLAAVRDGRIRNSRFVLFGREKPEPEGDWRNVLSFEELQPLSRNHIVSYLAKRGIEESSREDVADLLTVVTKGNTLAMATYVDSLLQLQKKRVAA